VTVSGLWKGGIPGAVLRVALGGILLWSGGVKLMSLPSFALTVRAYDVLPLWLVHPFAIWLPGAEVVTGALLLLGIWTRSSALTVSGMFVAFAIALGINVARGADMSCGCFGLDGMAATLPEALVRSLLLLSAALALVWRPDTACSVDAVLMGKRADS